MVNVFHANFRSRILTKQDVTNEQATFLQSPNPVQSVLKIMVQQYELSRLLDYTINDYNHQSYFTPLYSNIIIQLFLLYCNIFVSKKAACCLQKSKNGTTIGFSGIEINY